MSHARSRIERIRGAVFGGSASARGSATLQGMRALCVCAVLFVLTADAQQDAGEPEAVADREVTLELSPGQARPGDLVSVTLRSVAGRGCPTAMLDGRPLQFFRIPTGCRAFIGLPVELTPGTLSVTVQRDATGDDTGSGEATEPASVTLGTLEILPANFNVRELTVSRKFTEPAPAAKRRMRADQAAFDAAYDQPFSPPKFSQPFVWPMQTQVTAPFGDLRTFNGKKQSQHYGIDLDGNIGDPVTAANDGVVVMARDNYASGQTVLLSHGAGLYTAYFHFSKIDVREGQKVKAGQRIGRVGKTGRVTGPHLHFAVKVNGLYVDPASLMRVDVSAR